MSRAITAGTTTTTCGAGAVMVPVLPGPPHGSRRIITTILSRPHPAPGPDTAPPPGPRLLPGPRPDLCTAEDIMEEDAEDTFPKRIFDRAQSATLRPFSFRFRLSPCGTRKKYGKKRFPGMKFSKKVIVYVKGFPGRGIFRKEAGFTGKREKRQGTGRK